MDANKRNVFGRMGRNHHGHLSGAFAAILIFLFGLVSVVSAPDVLTPQMPTGYALNIPPTEAVHPTSLTESILVSETAPDSSDLCTALLEHMTLEEKIYQIFLVRPEDLGKSPIEFDDAARSALDTSPVGGIVLFSGNLKNREQCIKIIDDYQKSSKIPMLIGVDEEGGNVSRLGSNPAMGITPYPPMQEIGMTMDLNAAYSVGFTLGTELKALGFNLDFAPVADVNTNPNNPVIGSRAFSAEAGIAADMVSSCIYGFRDAQMISCIKHFPGHGDTQTDTHWGNADTHKTLTEMQMTEFLPFQAGIAAGAPVVMVGHISCPGVTGDQIPASLSAGIVTKVLRNDLGFQGVVITDAMNMGAISQAYPCGEAAVLALEAGCDMILIPESLQEAAEAVKSALASGRLTEERLNESILRILKLKLEYGIIRNEDS